MDRKELHRRIIKSFVEPSLFYVPDGKKNDGLRIYTKYYNVYTKKVEEYDLVSKIIHTPAIKDEYGYVTHPSFNMDGYYVIYDENHEIVAESKGNNLKKHLDKNYPKGVYTIHETVIPMYGFKQMDDIVLKLPAYGKLIDVNKTVYRELLGYVVCCEPQTFNFHLPFGIDKVPINTNLGIGNHDVDYQHSCIGGGELPYNLYQIRELCNGNHFKNLYSCFGAGSSIQEIDFSIGFHYSEADAVYMGYPYGFDTNYNLLNYDGWYNHLILDFRTHRKIPKSINNTSYTLLSTWWEFGTRIVLDLDNGEKAEDMPTVSELENAVDQYILSKNPKDLQIMKGKTLYWLYPSEESINLSFGSSYCEELLYDNINKAFIIDNGYHNKYEVDAYTPYYDINGNEISRYYHFEAFLSNIEITSDIISNNWDKDDEATCTLDYSLQYKDTYFYTVGKYRYYLYVAKGR